MRRLALVVAVLSLPCPALADPLDEFGFGDRAAGTAGATSVTARGAEAAHDNPAGVAHAEHATVMVGYGYGALGLDINGRDAAVLDAHGTTMGVALPIDLGARLRVALGVALYLPDQFMARIQFVPPTEPHFVRLANDPHRVVIDPSLSLKIGEHVSIGAGASLLADARGNGISFNVGVVSGEKVGESALDARLPVRAAPLVGALITPTERARIGVAYRGELSLDIALDILANVDVAGVVTGDAVITARAINYFTPRQVQGGVSYDLTEDLTASAAVTWINWSAFPTGVASILALVALDVTPPLVQTESPPANFEDIVVGRGGVEYRIDGARTDVALRAGYGFLPSPVPPQTSLTSFADNDRHELSVGAALVLADWQPYLTRPIELGVALQWHHLAGRLTVKDARDFPGEAFSSGGDIVHLTTTAKVSF